MMMCGVFWGFKYCLDEASKDYIFLHLFPENAFNFIALLIYYEIYEMFFGCSLLQIQTNMW
jgi:hypothetical protein